MYFDFYVVQPYLIINGSIHLTLWNLEFLTRGMMLILGVETPPRGILILRAKLYTKSYDVKFGAETLPRGLR